MRVSVCLTLSMAAAAATLTEGMCDLSSSSSTPEGMTGASSAGPPAVAEIRHNTSAATYKEQRNE